MITWSVGVDWFPEEGGVEVLEDGGDDHLRRQQEEMVTLPRDVHHHLTAVAKRRDISLYHNIA